VLSARFVVVVVVVVAAAVAMEIRSFAVAGNENCNNERGNWTL